MGNEDPTKRRRALQMTKSCFHLVLHLGLKVKNRKQVTPNVLSFDPYTQSSQGLLIIFQSDDKAHQSPYPRLELDVLNSSSYHEVSARDDFARPCIASIIRSDPLYCTII